MGDGGIDQGQLDRLFTSALEAAVARIEKDGHFFPLVFELRANGIIHNLAVLDLAPINGSEGVRERLAELLRPRAESGKIHAVAIVLHRPSEKAFCVQMRASNYSRDIEVPFSIGVEGLIRRRRRVTLGDFTAEQATNAIF
ncbi:hypothetical protein GRI34_08705 [Erythrobacter aquimaris]|uniref:Uncharacterized protein n=1 Tax=Qipengyuania aquimaris TaxID=255984 RepID=A0A6I4TN32_9SPHN|nr:hypothetical protein [Qipengyuania aquimaris]MXO96491.1 hypothetical protein [Qipengyuania aquimaris]